MRHTSVVALLIVTLMGVGASGWLDAKERRKPWPKPAPPPPPSPIYHPSSEPVMNEAQIERLARGHNEQLAREIETALASKDPRLGQDTDVLGHVLLRRAKRLGELENRHRSITQSVQEADAHGLANHFEALRDQLDERLRKGVRNRDGFRHIHNCTTAQLFFKPARPTTTSMTRRTDFRDPRPSGTQPSSRPSAIAFAVRTRR